MFPQVKLAMIFARLARQHGNKVLHSNNVDLLTKDLSYALQEQQRILSDPRKGVAMTAYDVLPVLVEVKLLSLLVAKKLGIDTTDKPVITLLDEIAKKSDERNGGKYTKGLRDTLEWTRELFANPEIQDVLKMEMTEITRPEGIRDVGKFMWNLALRSQDELTRVNEFLKRAKEAQENKDQAPQSAAPQSEAKPTPAKPKPPKAKRPPKPGNNA